MYIYTSFDEFRLHRIVYTLLYTFKENFANAELNNTKLLNIR